MSTAERLDQLINIMMGKPWLRKMNRPDTYDLTQEDVALILQALVCERQHYPDDKRE